MSSLFKGLNINYVPLVQCLRFRSKINITKPKPLHFERDVVEHLCVPKFKPQVKKVPYLPCYELCNEKAEIVKEEANPFEKIIAREILEKFNNSKLIAIFHTNKMDEEEEFETAVLFKRNGMKLQITGKAVITEALTGTIYEPVLRFFQSHTSVVYGAEPDLHTLMNVTKKVNGVLLLAAVLNNSRLLDYSEMKIFGKLPNLESARSNLLGTLHTTTQNLIHNITCHSNSLVHCLEQIKNHNNKIT